jgi:hypothetical protein
MKTLRSAVLVVASFLAAAGCTSPFRVPTPTRVDASVVVADEPEVLQSEWISDCAFVNVRIAGRGPFRFLLDTGAGAFVVSKTVARECGLERKELASIFGGPRAQGPNESVPVPEATRIDELRVGSFLFRDVVAMVFDMTPFDEAAWTRIDGILPACAFRGSLLVVDTPRRTVAVQAGELPAPDQRDVLSFEGDVPYVVATIDGGTVGALLDSGCRSAIIVPAARESSLGLRSAPAVVGRTRDIEGERDTRSARLEGDLTLGRWRFRKPIVDLQPALAPIFGTVVLREFRATYDFANGRVKIERMDDRPIDCASARDIGAGLIHRAGAWSVIGVLKGRAADRVGLHDGDRVVEIEGRAYGDLSFDEFCRLVRSRDAIRLVVAKGDARREFVVPVETLVE